MTISLNGSMIGQSDPDAALHALCDQHDALWSQKDRAEGWAHDLGGKAAEDAVAYDYHHQLDELEDAILAIKPATARGLMRLLDTLAPSYWFDARDPRSDDDEIDTAAARAVRVFLEALAISDGMPARAYHELPLHMIALGPPPAAVAKESTRSRRV